MTGKALMVIDDPTKLALFQGGYVSQYQAEVKELTSRLQEAREALELARSMDLIHQVTHWEGEVKSLTGLLEKAQARLVFYSQGFLPLPRMTYSQLQYAHTPIPALALTRLKEAKELNIFEEFGLIEAQLNRDPILIGVKRFPDNEEVHCFIAWWR